ncbi:MAG: HepT-like ribonuclease domain-containing protein [Betaproteobacteria bacterium]
MQPRSRKLLEDVRDSAAFIQQVIAFRNILIHGYDLVDHAVVWSVIETQLPALVDDVSALLREPA